MGLSLVIGSRHLCAASFSAWLALRRAGVTCVETVIPLARPDTAGRLARLSPVGSVPVLIVDDAPVAGALAIAEHAARRMPALWPDGAAGEMARRTARQAVEGFRDLATFMPMDLGARFSAPGMLLRPVAADLEALLALWAECRAAGTAGQPFLFGRFGVVDAMMAPWAARLVTYAIPLDGPDTAYVKALRGLPEWQAWERLAQGEIGEHPEPSRPVEAPPPARPLEAAHTAQAAPLPPAEPVPARAAARHPPPVAPPEPPRWSEPAPAVAPPPRAEPAARPPGLSREPTVPVDLARVTPGRRPGVAPDPTAEPAGPRLPLRRVKARDTIIAPDPEGSRRRNRILSIALGLAVGAAAATTPSALFKLEAEPVALLAPEDDASIPLPSPRLVVRYAGDDPTAQRAAERVAIRLAEEGYRVAAIEPTADRVDAPVIRYFVPADRPETRALADELSAALNRQVTAMLVPAAGAAAGTIEVWLGSLSG